MDTPKVAGIVLVLCMSGAASAQQTGNAPAKSGAQTEEAQPGQAGKTIDAPAAQGATNNASGTLMDKRANALSPKGASSPARTGEVKQ